MALSISSSAFSNQDAIPRKFTCDGDGVSPPLEWTGVPEKAKSLVLVVDDPDAPDPAKPERVFVHWMLLDIPPSADGLPEGVTPGRLPRGARAGKNDRKQTDYAPPCPPIGRHRYFFHLYALDTTLEKLHSPMRAELDAALAGHVLESAELVGTYQRAGKR